MNLTNLATRLDTLRLGKKGVSLFLHMMPMDATTAILLRNPLAGTKVDYELPGFYHAEFQLIVRTPDYDAGEQLMAAVTAALTLAFEDIGSQSFNFCRARTLPVAFPLSAGNLVEHSAMFEACYVEQ